MPPLSVASGETGNPFEGQFLPFNQAMFGAPCSKELDPPHIDDRRAVVHTSIDLPNSKYVFEGGRDRCCGIGRIGEHVR